MRRPRLILTVCIVASSSVAASAEVRREIKFPDLPGHKTLKCDFHMHTVFSDGTVWPTIRVDEAWREGLDAIAITDHIEVQPHKQDVPTNHIRPYAIALGRAKEKNILLIKGVEVTRDTPPGHFNVLFLKDIDLLDTKDFYDVFRQASQQNAYVFWNHPGWKGAELGQWGEAQTKLYEKRWLHGIEICNGDTYYVNAHRYAVEKNLAMIGNSDTHYPMSDIPYTSDKHRTLTLVFAKERSLKGIREALDSERTAVWYHNMIIGKRQYLSAFFDECIAAKRIHHRTKNSAMLEITNRCELDIELEGTSKTRPSKVSLPAGMTSLIRIAPPEQTDRQIVLSYRAVNFLIAPEEPLEVELRTPE